MTIAAAYLTSEGVVLGADSAVTVRSENRKGVAPSVLQILRHTQKVFEISQKPGEGRFGLCTWGSGSVLNYSHRTVVGKIADSIDKDATVSDVKDKLIEEVSSIIKQGSEWRSNLGYYVGGWNEKERIPECYRVEFDTDGMSKSYKMGLGEGSFSGAPEFFGRVFKGFDYRLPILLNKALREHMKDLPEDFNDIFEKAFSETSQKLLSIGYRELPIREAIDWVHSYLHLTIKAYKFQFGAPTCGGPIEIGFVTTDRNFRWVCHKSFDSAIKEEES